MTIRERLEGIVMGAAILFLIGSYLLYATGAKIPETNPNGGIRLNPGEQIMFQTGGTQILGVPTEWLTVAYKGQGQFSPSTCVLTHKEDYHLSLRCDGIGEVAELEQGGTTDFPFVKPRKPAWLNPHWPFRRQ